MLFLKDVANSVDPMLSFTFDTTTLNDDRKVPVLDLKVSLDENWNVLHEFYEKRTKNPRVILATSALSWRSKRTIMTQEAIRRLRNTNCGEAAQNFHLTNFMAKLKSSGYSEKFRHEIVMSAKQAYSKMLSDDAKGIKPLYRTRAEIECGKSESRVRKWWNKGETKYKAVLFVPATPGSELAHRIRLREAQLNQDPKERLKIVEKGGVKLRQILAKPDPFPKRPCDEPTCPLCKKSEFISEVSATKIPCDTQSIGYRWTCIHCKHTYEGESGRSARTRTKEHVSSIRRGNPANPMVKHNITMHPNAKPLFGIKILGAFKDPLSRQAEEGVRIYSANPNKIMNSKTEFHHPALKRISLIGSIRHHHSNSSKTSRK